MKEALPYLAIFVFTILVPVVLYQVIKFGSMAYFVGKYNAEQWIERHKRRKHDQERP